MTSEEAIEAIKMAVSQVEWEYPLEYAAAFDVAIEALEKQSKWVPVSERLPDKEFKKGRENGTVFNLYPCLVTRYATHSPVNPERLYVAKHYYDGNNFLNNGEQVCTEAVIAWMPMLMPEPYNNGGAKK